jgi:hypothetical protein
MTAITLPCVATLCATLLATPSTTVAQTTESSNAPVLQIPFDTTGLMAIVTIRINDSRPLRCILDTGMPEGAFLFDPAVGEELGLEYAATIPVRGTGPEPRMAGVAMGVTLQLDELVFENERVIVLQKASELASMGIEAVIGASVFNQYVVELDFEAAEVTLFDPDAFDDSESGESLPLTITATKPFIRATMSVDGKETVPVKLLVDSGAGKELSIRSDAVSAPTRVLNGIVSSGVGGDAPVAVGRVSSLDLGAFELTDLVGQFPESSTGMGGDGTLGMGVLRQFVVTFDYPGRRMLLRPGSSFGDPFEFNMAGLVMRPLAGGTLRVHNVIDASPAADVDVRSDDVIVAINGKSIDELGHRKVRHLLHQHGKKIVLTLERDGERMDVSVELRRLI